MGLMLRLCCVGGAVLSNRGDLAAAGEMKVVNLPHLTPYLNNLVESTDLIPAIPITGDETPTILIIFRKLSEFRKNSSVPLPSKLGNLIRDREYHISV